MLFHGLRFTLGYGHSFEIVLDLTQLIALFGQVEQWTMDTYEVLVSVDVLNELEIGVVNDNLVRILDEIDQSLSMLLQLRVQVLVEAGHSYRLLRVILQLVRHMFPVYRVSILPVRGIVDHHGIPGWITPLVASTEYEGLNDVCFLKPLTNQMMKLMRTEGFGLPVRSTDHGYGRVVHVKVTNGLILFQVGCTTHDLGNCEDWAIPDL